MLYIACITGVRYYSIKCSYGAAATRAWFSVLKFVTMWGLELKTFWLKEQALMYKKVSDISPKGAWSSSQRVVGLSADIKRHESGLKE